ncbi:AvrD family protein [Staphylococcus caprae]
MKEKNYEKNVHFDSIEEIIGDSSNRYFGDGYKKVEYNIQSMNIS